MTTTLVPRIYVLILFYSCGFQNRSNLIIASGVFEIRLEEFVNEGGHEQLGNCCEGVVSSDNKVCSEPCRTSFRICFSHFRSDVGSDKKCTFGAARTPILGENTIVSSQFGGAESNIVRMNFSFTWPRAFSLVIEATHRKDENSSERLIARMEKIGSVDANTDWKTETQTQQEKILRYSYRVRCDQYYYGDSCSNYCRPRDDLFGHWKCDQNGEKVCLPGWKSKKGSPKSYCLEPRCLAGCNTSHGYCKRPDECLCRQGWKGALCNQCRTHPMCLHGTCHRSFECNCESGWGGMLCNHDLNYCINHKPCKNSARCTNVGQGSFSCECATGFTGRHCDVKVDECDSNPCLNGAKCTAQEIGYTCECRDNFFGANCEDTHLMCDTIQCKNGGTCVKDDTKYHCLCKTGFRGDKCELGDRCTTGSCLNGGTCRGSPNSLTCSCPPGFYGSRCQAGECEIGTCKNGGKCSREPDGFRCECRVGFSGPRCELAWDPCQSHPCKNDGVCKKTRIGYRCACSSRFTGRNCGIPVNCFESPCKNGGKCVHHGFSYVCTCTEGYHGRDCEQSTEATDSMLSSYSDGRDTKIIVLTKNDKSGLSTVQWITVCFASTFLLVVFSAVAVCVAYQRFGKSSYTRGRVTKTIPVPRKIVNKSRDDCEVKSTSIVQTIPEKIAFTAFEAPGGPKLCPKLHRPSGSVELLTDQIALNGVGDCSIEVSRRIRGLSYSSQSDVRCYRERPCERSVHRSISLGRLRTEDSSQLPTYQEACYQSLVSSQVL